MRRPMRSRSSSQHGALVEYLWVIPDPRRSIGGFLKSSIGLCSSRTWSMMSKLRHDDDDRFHILLICRMMCRIIPHSAWIARWLPWWFGHENPVDRRSNPRPTNECIPSPSRPHERATALWIPGTVSASYDAAGPASGMSSNPSSHTMTWGHPPLSMTLHSTP